MSEPFPTIMARHFHQRSYFFNIDFDYVKMNSTLTSKLC